LLRYNGQKYLFKTYFRTSFFYFSNQHDPRFSNSQKLTDSYRHKGLRKRMIDALRQKGITNETVLAAMAAVPRHFFLEKTFEDHAYEDKAFPIGFEQTISQPYTVAYQSVLLNLKNGDKVLEIGTGSGYQAAILAVLGAKVFTVERQEELYFQTKKLLDELGFNTVKCFFRDGSKGLSEKAPFDKIIVTAGAPVIPEPLKAQLAIGGTLVIPVGESVQQMIKITRISDTEFREERLDNFRFVPFLEGVNRKIYPTKL
jgi:protein-L-isoaspartate(D-aspartate) O-methyltransferase